MEPRHVKQSRFRIEKLEERIAPVTQTWGNGDQVSGEVTITAGPGGASGCIEGTLNNGGFDNVTGHVEVGSAADPHGLQGGPC
ncbi:MAG: hypothetical protein L0Z62_14110 [Gemmataceae bacterium]|nr:hypothetical protein [Gemmataceae bacterium]